MGAARAPLHGLFLCAIRGRRLSKRLRCAFLLGTFGAVVGEQETFADWQLTELRGVEPVSLLELGMPGGFSLLDRDVTTRMLGAFILPIARLALVKGRASVRAFIVFLILGGSVDFVGSFSDRNNFGPLL